MSTETEPTYTSKNGKVIQQEEISAFLNDLRESGATNMFGASPYVVREFELTDKDARKATVYWMEHFGK